MPLLHVEAVLRRTRLTAEDAAAEDADADLTDLAGIAPLAGQAAESAPLVAQRAEQVAVRAAELAASDRDEHTQKAFAAELRHQAQADAADAYRQAEAGVRGADQPMP